MIIQERKYQIFISSTYIDLVNARQSVIESILKMYHIPIGMEMFSAADEEQWNIIKNTIDNSDYYILIIGFRYGSETAEGISYTEKEYDYALSKGIPILVFIRDRNIATIPSERDKNQSKINKFITKIEKKQREIWMFPEDLSAKVTASLYKIFTYKPQKGWIRSNLEYKNIHDKNVKTINRNCIQNYFVFENISYEMDMDNEECIYGYIKNISNMPTTLISGCLYYKSEQNQTIYVEQYNFTSSVVLYNFDMTRFTYYKLNKINFNSISFEIQEFVDFNTGDKYRVVDNGNNSSSPFNYCLSLI